MIGCLCQLTSLKEVWFNKINNQSSAPNPGQPDTLVLFSLNWLSCFSRCENTWIRQHFQSVQSATPPDSLHLRWLITDQYLCLQSNEVSTRPDSHTFNQTDEMRSRKTHLGSRESSRSSPEVFLKQEKRSRRNYLSKRFYMLKTLSNFHSPSVIYYPAGCQCWSLIHKLSYFK